MKEKRSEKLNLQGKAVSRVLVKQLADASPEAEGGSKAGLKNLLLGFIQRRFERGREPGGISC